ncbi:hypothetical protein [Actinomadura alba]|uniref:Uncharacterized protein n=1 Tax=Actinomadura alba TaxID=406431 RepID=A0ABR7LNT4_9ACTN|nr:hypothetical protein [Actinomadura alba]MBC6466338.1 hypothetical protein [Actinomadura alba]
MYPATASKAAGWTAPAKSYRSLAWAPNEASGCCGERGTENAGLDTVGPAVP